MFREGIKPSNFVLEYSNVNLYLALVRSNLEKCPSSFLFLSESLDLQFHIKDLVNIYSHQLDQFSRHLHLITGALNIPL